MGIKDEEMTEEQARQKAIELIRIEHSIPISEYNTDERVISMYNIEYNWFMQGWKEAVESITPP